MLMKIVGTPLLMLNAQLLIKLLANAKVTQMLITLANYQMNVLHFANQKELALTLTGWFTFII